MVDRVKSTAGRRTLARGVHYCFSGASRRPQSEGRRPLRYKTSVEAVPRAFRSPSGGQLSPADSSLPIRAGEKPVGASSGPVSAKRCFGSGAWRSKAPGVSFLLRQGPGSGEEPGNPGEGKSAIR